MSKDETLKTNKRVFGRPDNRLGQRDFVSKIEARVSEADKERAIEAIFETLSSFQSKRENE